MIKTAYKNNKVSFVCFAVAVSLILLGFVVGFFPDIDRTYAEWGVVLYNYSYQLTAYDVIIFFACVSSIIGLAYGDSEKFVKVLRPFAYILIIAYLSQSFFAQLFCELFEGSNLYFSTNTLFIFLADLIILVACILLLIARRKNLSLTFNYVAVGCILFAFLLQFIFNIIIISDYVGSKTDAIFSLFISFSVPLFFVGDLFITLKENAPVVSTDLGKKLSAIRIKYEVGSITKEEYEKQMKDLLGNM